MAQRFFSTDRQGGSGDGYYVIECDNCEDIIGVSDDYQSEMGNTLCIKCKKELAKARGE